MAITYTGAHVTGVGVNTFTTGSIDTSGMNFLSVVVCNYTGAAGVPVVTDSNSNTWTEIAPAQGLGDIRVAIWYAKNAIVGAGHTFTVTGAVILASAAVSAYAGVETTAPHDTSGTVTINSAVTSIQGGSITPSEDNELIISAFGVRDDTSGDTYGIDLSFTKTDEVDPASGVNVGCASAYLIQTTAAAKQPTWSWTNSNIARSFNACFKAAAGGGGGATQQRLMMMGVGP